MISVSMSREKSQLPTTDSVRLGGNRAAHQRQQRAAIERAVRQARAFDLAVEAAADQRQIAGQPVVVRDVPGANSSGPSRDATLFAIA